jgi:hypothetical protein
MKFDCRNTHFACESLSAGTENKRKIMGRGPPFLVSSPLVPVGMGSRKVPMLMSLLYEMVYFPVAFTHPPSTSDEL